LSNGSNGEEGQADDGFEHVHFEGDVIKDSGELKVGE